MNVQTHYHVQNQVTFQFPVDVCNYWNYWNRRRKLNIGSSSTLRPASSEMKYVTWGACWLKTNRIRRSVACFFHVSCFTWSAIFGGLSSGYRRAFPLTAAIGDKSLICGPFSDSDSSSPLSSVDTTWHEWVCQQRLYKGKSCSAVVAVMLGN